MIGTIVNTAAIVTGSLIGSLFKKFLNDKTKEALLISVGLCSMAIGINIFSSSVSKSEIPVLFIIAIAIGTVFGTIFDIEGKFKKLTSKIGDEACLKGLQTAILLFCIGTLSILGPVQSALFHNNIFLFTNATLDFITSIILSCAFGIGIIWSALVLFLWQGSIYFLSLYAKNFISDSLFVELSIIGGILILSTSLSVLKIKDIKTMNLLPSLVVAPVIFLIVSFLKSLF